MPIRPCQFPGGSFDSANFYDPHSTNVSMLRISEWNVCDEYHVTKEFIGGKSYHLDFGSASHSISDVIFFPYFERKTAGCREAIRRPLKMGGA